VTDSLVEVEGRQLKLTNLDKVLYPDAGFTKGEVIHYYASIAPTLLTHTTGRCVTFRRYPNGVDQASFFEKRCPQHRPDWVDVALGPGDRNGDVGYCLIEEAPAVVWAANLAALELHTPMALAEDLEAPLMVVFDLDPGPNTDITECAQVALELRDLLEGVDLDSFAKTSGSKGMQLYIPLNNPDHGHDDASDFAKAAGSVLARRRPKQITINMAKSERPGRVFIDWSQNSRHKTTICPYSLRARPHPTVSTPVTWDEVEDCANGMPLSFEAAEVVERVAELGDLFEPTVELVQHLPKSAG
jgi:bifunctional non-homologous end joining protein LigD